MSVEFADNFMKKNLKLIFLE